VGITFRVSDVERASAPLRPPPREHFELLGRGVEAWGSNPTDPAPAPRHGFLDAAAWAFASHYPLVLTPDAVWLCIAQGFATHVRLNAERLRGKFVRHQGKETIAVRRDDFVKGSAENPWPEAFGTFSDEIAARIGRQRDLVVCDFSTTGPCERAASEIVLMDAMQEYFAYEMCSVCGIPEVTLEGTVRDWESIRRRAVALGEYELGFWVEGLLPVLDRLVTTARGQVDVAFWRSFYKLNDSSGGPYVTGWINVLFPYLRDGRGTFFWNGAVSTWAAGLEAGFGGGPELSHIPGGLSRVPFLWKIGSEPVQVTFPMELLGGFVGIAQDPGTLALRPAIGWAVRDETKEAAPPARRPPWEPEEAESRADSGPEPRRAAPPECMATIHGRTGAGAVLLAGRVTLADTVTPADVIAVAARVGALAETHDIFMHCAALVPGWSLPHFSMVGKLVVGIPAEGNAPAALLRAKRVPESVWAELDALVPGGMGAETAVHLGRFGAASETVLVFGEPDGRGGLRGVEVARVSPGGPRHLVVDVSKPVHASRVAAAQDAGVGPGAGAYYLDRRSNEPE
jgi:hypothetical protein